MKSVEFYCDLLHKIHNSYPIESPERDAIEIAAKALLFSMSQDGFQNYLSNDGLTQEQREYLTRLGLDSDQGQKRSSE